MSNIKSHFHFRWIILISYVLSALTFVTANAQSINWDICTNQQSNPGPTPTTVGGPANQPGLWSGPGIDINGVPTNISIEYVGISGKCRIMLPIAGLGLGDSALLRDVNDYGLPAPNITVIRKIKNLKAGKYDVFVITYKPKFDSWKGTSTSGVTVNGLPEQIVSTPVAPQWSGYEQGKTHSHHTVHLTENGTITIALRKTALSTSNLVLSGIQLKWAPSISVEHLVCLRTTGTVLYAGTPINGQPEARSHHCEDDEVFAFLDINGGTLEHGDKVNIRSYHNKFFQAVSSGALNANVNTNVSSDTAFTIQKANGVGPIQLNTVVTLHSEFNKFVTAEDGGGAILNANRAVDGWWERFIFLPATENLFCLKTSNGQNYVSSENDLITVNANRIACKAWEKHSIIDINGGNLESGDYVFIRSHHSLYWSAQPSGELEANRNTHGPWERFEIFKSKSPDTKIKGLC